MPTFLMCQYASFEFSVNHPARIGKRPCKTLAIGRTHAFLCEAPYPLCISLIKQSPLIECSMFKRKSELT